MRIVKSLDTRYPGNNIKHGEIFPTNTAPILSIEQDEIKPELSTWGFPRFGAKGVIINARSETADERPMFKRSLHNRRCAIPSTGFFEWSQSGKKVKYRFNLPETRTLYMAGIFNVFNEESRFTILTTKANDSVKDIHNRMPVILLDNMIEDWIISEEFALSYIHAGMPSLQREIFI